ncbi:MAG: hypothetical protein AAGF94_11150 [Pseudomonadota bacterium]
MIGNQIENAFTWPSSTIIFVEFRTGVAVATKFEDDGLGVFAEHIDSELGRGSRIEEKTKDHGLCLSIAKELLGHCNPS